jgi:hypothetical protein
MLINYLKCRVMLGGEIYYRAIGRPWGPAADFIVKFHLPAGLLGLTGGPGRPRAVGASCAFKFESGRALRHSTPVRPPSAGRPPEPSVCPTVRKFVLAAGLPARAPRALVLSEWEAGVSGQ